MVDSTKAAGKNPKGTRNVKLELYGQRFSVRTDDAEEYLQKLAAHVNKKMTEIRSATGRVETSQIALLALLDISDALFRERAKNKALKVDLLSRSERLLHTIDEMAGALEVKESVVAEPESNHLRQGS
jgi:cell division protein ZapA